MEGLACWGRGRLPHLDQRPRQWPGVGVLRSIRTERRGQGPHLHRRGPAWLAVRPRHGDHDTAQHRLRPHGGMGEPQRGFHASILHAPDDRTIPHVLYPLQHLIDIPFPVHEMNQARWRSRSCGPGRFPHDLPGLVDAVEPFPAFLGLRAWGVARRPCPGLEPQDAEHRPLIGQCQGTMEQYTLGQTTRPNRP